jgi:hypothetical protein
MGYEQCTRRDCSCLAHLFLKASNFNHFGLDFVNVIQVCLKDGLCKFLLI